MAVKIFNRFAPQLLKLEKSINNIPARQYYMALSLLVLLIVKFVFMPWFEQNVDRQVQLQQLSNAVKTPELMVEQAEKMKLALEQKRKVQQQWQQRLAKGPESQVRVETIKKLQNSAKEAGLLYLSSRWLPTPPQRPGEEKAISPMLYSVVIRGDYNRVKDVLAQWQEYEPFIRLEHVRIEKKVDVGVVAADITLAVYRMN